MLSPGGIALDLASGKMYWTDSEEGVQWANLDGSNVETVVIPGLDFSAYQQIDE